MQIQYDYDTLKSRCNEMEKELLYLQETQNENMQLKAINSTLMDEAESYQQLLQGTTHDFLNGPFMASVKKSTSEEIAETEIRVISR